MRAHHPAYDGGDGKARQRSERVDEKIFQSRMPSRCEKLKQFERADQNNGNASGRQPVSRIGGGEDQPKQHEGEGVLAFMGDGSMRSESGRSKGCKRHGCSEQPGDKTQNDSHGTVIARLDGPIRAS
jgi:hypothetical protein